MDIGNVDMGNVYISGVGNVDNVCISSVHQRQYRRRWRDHASIDVIIIVFGVTVTVECFWTALGMLHTVDINIGISYLFVSVCSHMSDLMSRFAMPNTHTNKWCTA